MEPGAREVLLIKVEQLTFLEACYGVGNLDLILKTHFYYFWRDGEYLPLIYSVATGVGIPTFGRYTDRYG